MAKPKQSISERLSFANVAISNALSDAQIGKLLAEYGYNTQKLNEGKGVFTAADTAVKRQIALYGAQKEASKKADDAEKAARSAYQSLSQVAKAAFGQDKAKLGVLGLDRAMPNPVPLFITMATALFDNAMQNKEIADVLKNYGYTAERLTTERKKIEQLESARAAYESAKGAAQQATAEQKKAMEALDAWMSGFVKVARVALKEQPQLLEKLGILKRGEKTPAQRQASAKSAQTKKANKEKTDTEEKE